MKLTELNKLLNSELTTKIKKTSLENDELFINVKVENLYSVLLFLKTDDKCRFKQLIDIAAADYLDEEERFEICYLLLYGEFPNAEQQEDFISRIKKEQNIHEDMKRFFDGFPITAHPMAILSAMVTSLSSYQGETDNTNIEKKNY